MFPSVVLNFDINCKSSICAVEKAVNSNQKIFIVTMKDSTEETFCEKDVYSLGVLANIKQVIKQSENSVRVLAEGIARAQAAEFVREEKFLQARIIKIKSKTSEKDVFDEALLRKAREVFAEHLGLCGKVSTDLILDLVNYEEMGKTADYIAANVALKTETKQHLLEEMNPLSRLQSVTIFLSRENEILKLGNEISKKLKDSLDKSQKEYFLREQIKVISRELGDGVDTSTEAEEFKSKLESLSLSKEVHDKLLKECNNFARISPHSPDASVQRNYLDFCFSLPWNTSDKETLGIARAQKILDKDHFGLKDVKRRIIEFMAVKKLTPNIKGQILCLSGPPGVGKTSIAKSLAKALNRKYVRISLGGVNDESEIRGHRKTYLGAMPGRILSSLSSIKSNNPLMLLDEIDKLSKDYKGDPAAALLEVLDPEQNVNFHDRYADFPFDLSNVMFIATANDKSKIPGPLYDRMENIELYSYTYEEKFHIAKNHLISKQLHRHGLTKRNFSITDDALKKLIECYTKEAGVRELERKISSLMRKVACGIVEKTEKSVLVDNERLVSMLGPEKYKKESFDKENQIGVVKGLAWTSVGGELLPIEVALMKGKGKLHITGSLGDVMKESAEIAVSYIRSNSKKLGINEDFYKEYDIHIHAPEGAVPKDGPSAGVTMTTALVSALSKRPVRSDVAMTGEITLKGKVLPIGGLREKTMAAYKEGMKTVIIPEGNKNDLQKIDEVVKNAINFVTADNLDTVFDNALVRTRRTRNTK